MGIASSSRLEAEEIINSIRNGASSGRLRALILSPRVVNARIEGGNTPLHEAALTGHWQAIGLLLSLGARPNLRNDDGETPLTSAIAWDNRRAVQVLLSGGANPNQALPDRITPLMLAAMHHNVGIMKDLINFGAHLLPLKDRKIKKRGI